MAKYSQEFKFKVVQAYLNGEGGLGILEKRFQVNHATIRLWIENYKKHGLDGLRVQTSRVLYTVEFKLHAVQMVMGGTSVHEVRRQLNISGRAINRDWLRRYSENGIDSLKPRREGRPSRVRKPELPESRSPQSDQDKTQEQLLEELAYLRAENAFLKKRRALRLAQGVKEAAGQQLLRNLYQD